MEKEEVFPIEQQEPQGPMASYDDEFEGRTIIVQQPDFGHCVDVECRLV
jgi:hypothetical protein